MNMEQYLNRGIGNILKTASRFYLKDTKGFAFLSKYLIQSKRSEKLRSRWKEEKGTAIPPFLIASITGSCNLACAGCYARADGNSSKPADELTDEKWNDIFQEASALGIAFILLAGGEPLMRPAVIRTAAEYPNIIFPVFTNGVLIDDEYISLFDRCRNLIPVLSIEGGQALTDQRRGSGIYEQATDTMKKLKQHNILFGASITVTNRNMEEVTELTFVSRLCRQGCGVVFYVEYVPAEEGTEDLTLSPAEIARMDQKVSLLKPQFASMILLSFPGDEEYMGGCLAAGRGFFHINPTGQAEPCPFSPYSRENVRTGSLLSVLQSPFFHEVRQLEQNAKEHSGGCALFHFREEVAALQEQSCLK